MMWSFVMVLPPAQYDDEALRRVCEENGWAVVRSEPLPLHVEEDDPA